MNTENNDKQLEDFFENLKTQDAEELNIPQYKTPVQNPNRSLIYWFSAAAAVLLAVFFLTKPAGIVNGDTSPAEFIVSLEYEEPKGEETGFLLEDDQELTSWDFPTDALIEDFND